MRHTKRPSSVVLILLLLLTTFSTISITKCDDNDSGGDGSLIDETCKRTPHYDLCVSSLQSSQGASDVRGLARAMVDTVLSKATETLDMIRALLRQGPADPLLEKSLAYCAELYIPVVKYSLPQAIDAVTGGHFGFANYGISDAAKQANACDKAIAGLSGGPASALPDRNALLNDLSEVAAAIVELLLEG